MRGADPASPLRGQLERKRLGLDDQVVVAERVPLLEVHAGAVYVPSPGDGQMARTPLLPARPTRARVPVFAGSARVVARGALPGPLPLARGPRAGVRRGLLRQCRAGDRGGDPAR